MIRAFIKTIIKSVFRWFGLEVSAITPRPEPPPLYANLDKVLDLNRAGIQASYECPLDQCLILNGFSFSENGWHPFLEAYHDMFSGPGKIRFRGSFLEKYYNTWMPGCSGEAMAGFRYPPAQLASTAPFILHAPWMDASPSYRQALMERIILDENRASGCPGLGAGEGYGLHGPVSETKGDIEFQRLVKIYKSIKAKGYDRTHGDGDITAIGIEFNGQFRFCVMHGQHRVAAATALGFKTIPVNITKVVHYREIRHWPQVYRGYWSEEQARKFIEHLFSFDSRAWAETMGLLVHKGR
jgi:hypothetical protein